MTERDVRDEENITWKCIQAYSGLSARSAEEAAEIAGQNNTVEVICTPSGTYQTVRLTLPTDWLNAISDQDLLNRIQENKV